MLKRVFVGMDQCALKLIKWVREIAGALARL
jgi:hypothetical protein